MNDETKAVIKLLLVALAIVTVVITIGIILVQCIDIPEGGFLGGGYDNR